MRGRRSYRPELEIAQILGWVDAHKKRTGAWPRSDSGPVRGGPLEENWRRVDSALRLGLRGLPGGSSLAQLLLEQRQVRNQTRPPPLRLSQLLEWADEHHQRTGSWPTSTSGPIGAIPGETWRAIDDALRLGLRGLKRGTSLAQFLARKRAVRNHRALPPLKVADILVWVDEHQRRTGSWPLSTSGPVGAAPTETWNSVDTALHLGRRGLPGGSSLSRLLADQRGARNSKQLPKLTFAQIRRWARAHRLRTGALPTRSSGTLLEAPHESWSAIHSALVTGCRGLPAGLTLARVLTEEGTLAPSSTLSRLTLAQVLAWADAHHERTGAWPHARVGPIAEAPGETWRGIDQALHKNQRGLKTNMTLAQLLSERRGHRSRRHAPLLVEKRVLSWADAHLRRTGEWPNFRSGPIPEAPGETWRAVDASLQQGARGLPGGFSLARFLAEKRAARNRSNLPPLRLKQIALWAKEHHRRVGSWPMSGSGAVSAAPHETWKSIDLALRWGYRGLTGGLSLARLLARELGIRNRASLPQLNPERIVAWATAHHQRTGAWPHSNSGKVRGAVAESWSGVDQALRSGYRGLPGGSSLAKLLESHR
jgi:hypothetical protein